MLRLPGPKQSKLNYFPRVDQINLCGKAGILESDLTNVHPDRPLTAPSQATDPEISDQNLSQLPNPSR